MALRVENLAVLAHFGEQLARLRGARNLSKEKFARLAGLNPHTLGRAEASPVCTLRTSTIQMLLDALSRATPALSAKEAVWLADEVGMDRKVALRYVPISTPDHSTPASSLLDDLRVLVGEDRVRTLLSCVLECVRAPQATTPAGTLIVRHPAVQREGFVEERETEYELRDPPPPAQPKRKPRQEPGF